MIESAGNIPFEQPFNVHIGAEEWAEYSFQNKVRLLYRLKQSKTQIAQELVKTVSLLVEEEQRQLEIDYDATLKKCIEE